MGVASVLKVVGSNLKVVDEEDFDKALLGALSEIAYSLNKNHPFRRLVELVTFGSPTANADERLAAKLEKIAGEGDEDNGCAIADPRALIPFKEYVSGDMVSQWDALFPGRQTGLRNLLKYHFKSRQLETSYNTRPTSENAGWCRDDYARLLELVRKAIESECYILHTIY